jgi:hypothetical protein
MIKDDYIVRIWPSGIITMGKVHFSQKMDLKDRPMFKALESYSNEGGVVKGEIYGYSDNAHGFKHRLATPVEIRVFHLYGLNKKEVEIKQLHRQIVLESIV